MVNDPIKKGLSEVDLKTFYHRTLCFGFPTSLLSIHMSNNVLTETALITVTTNFIRFFCPSVIIMQFALIHPIKVVRSVYRLLSLS